MAFSVVNSTFERFSEEEITLIQAGKANPYQALLADPPYGISFLGKKWDKIGDPEAFQGQVKLWGTNMRQLLCPGALVFLFGGTRTWHRLAAGMEDAGFALCDTIMWLHGQGFPKNSRLKPAWEPILCFKAPGIAANGVGKLNINGARIGTGAFEWKGQPVEGRYPANLAMDIEAAELLGDNARFYYCAKPSRREREQGCELLPKRCGGSNAKGFTKDVSNGNDRNKAVYNNHPTVKPINLTKWLASLLLVPEGRLLVPFSGSGSEMIGAFLAGWNEVTGVEMDTDYCAIAQARLTHWTNSAAGAAEDGS